jgi:succinate dehydrogenase / fumarate reductase flavoprotein subunit
MDTSQRFNTDLLGALETEHLLSFSEIIVTSALARTESRGAHYRTDHTKRNDTQWLQHTLAHKNGADAPRLDYKSVTVFMNRFPPQERKY